MYKHVPLLSFEGRVCLWWHIHYLKNANAQNVGTLRTSHCQIISTISTIAQFAQKINSYTLCVSYKVIHVRITISHEINSNPSWPYTCAKSSYLFLKALILQNGSIARIRQHEWLNLCGMKQLLSSKLEYTFM